MKPLVFREFLKDIILRVEKGRNVRIISFAPVGEKDISQPPDQDTEYICRIIIYAGKLSEAYGINYSITYSELRLYNTRSVAELIIEKIDSEWMNIIKDPKRRKEEVKEWME